MARQIRESPTKAGQQRSPLNLKTSPELRARIQEAAAASGLSMTQEVERRLLDSFGLEDQLGGQDGLAFFRAAAGAIRRVEDRTGATWTKDTATWHGAKKMLEQQVRIWRPAPPNAPAIVVALQAQAKAEAHAGAKRAAYVKLFPGGQAVSFGLAAGIQAAAEGRVWGSRLPAEAESDIEREAMERLRGEIREADAAVALAKLAVEDAFREYDEAQVRGTALADDLLAAIEAVDDRDARGGVA